MSNFNVNVPLWNDITAVQITDDARLVADEVIIPTSAGDLALSVSKFGLRMKIGQRINYDYQMLKQVPTNFPLNIEQNAEQIVVSAGDIVVEIKRLPFAFLLKQGGRIIQQTATDGHFVRRYRMPPLARVDNGWFISLELGSSE